MISNLTLVVILLVMGCTFSLVMAVRSRRLTAAFAGIGDANGGLQAGKPGHQVEKSAVERLLRPLLRRLYRLGKVLTPKHSVTEIQQNLIMAGQPHDLTVTDFLGLRFLAGVTGGIFAYFLASTGYEPSMAMALSTLGFGLGIYVPNFWLKNQVAQRQKEIAIALPSALDMMSICVEAGLGFEAAMQKVATYDNHALAVELRRVISEIRIGVRRIDALRHLAERTGVPEVGSFVAVLVQSDKLGVAIREVLNTQSEQMRYRRRQRAEEEAHKAPLRMLFPMILFIFPALFIILLGPAVPMILEAF